MDSSEEPGPRAAPGADVSLRAVFDRISDGIVALDRDWRYVYVNQRAAELLQRQRPADLIGRHIWTEYPEGVGQPFHRAYERAFATQQPVVIEEHYAPWDRWFENRIYPSPDGLSIYFTEITARKREEARLRAAEERHRITLQSIGDAVIATGADGRVELMNPVAEALTGWRAADAIGRPLEEVFRIVDEAGGAPVESPVRRVLREGQVVGLANHTLLVARDGSARPIADSGAPIRDGSGALVGVVLVFRDQTEERAAQEALAERERRYRLLFEANPQPSWVYDLETLAFLAVNDAAVERYGYSRAEFLAMTLADIRPPEDLSRLLDNVAHVSSGLDHAGRWRHRRKDGSLIAVEITSHTLEFDGRAAELVLASDITDRVQAESALRASEARFRNFFDAGLVGMAITVPDKGWGRFNDRLCEMLGYTQQQMAGLTWAEVTHPDDLAADLAQFERLLAGASDGYELDKRFIRRDGSVMHGAIAVRVERDAAGRAERFFAIVADISARRAAEESLRVKEAALDAALAAIALADPQGRLTYVNPAFCALWRAAPEDLLGTPAVAHWADAGQAQQVTDALLAQGRWAGEMRARRADGSEFDAQLLGSMVRDAAGRPLCLMASFVDITESRQARETLARSRDELERLVQERTAELVAARDQAQRANRAKSEFLSRMSHELRTPLNAILGFGQLLDMEPALDARLRGYAQQTLRAGRHLLALIDDVLDLARIEAGRVTLAPEALALPELVEDCLRMVAPAAAQRRIGLRSQGLAGAAVQADRTRLRQVLLNLLSNAIKYNVQGGTVRIEAAPAAAGRLRITIADTGPGIPLALQSQLFQPFNRLGAEAGPIEGTGIGLSIARQLVEMMGGAVGVDSRPGEGSRFWFELPVASGRTLPAVGGTAPAALPPAATTALTVLYVEDNAANRVLMEQVLAQRRPDIRLLTAATAADGLALARAQPPALLLLDLQLPDGDGCELLARLRDEPAARTVPAIAVTAFAMPEDVQRTRAAGFAEHLTKPLDLARLDALLARLLPPRG